MTRKLSAESAKRLLSEVAGKPHRFALCCVADEGLTGDPLHGRPECSIEVAGWFLVPFVDCGDWDYVDRVVSPDGDVYDVDPQEIPADLDDDARNAHVR